MIQSNFNNAKVGDSVLSLIEGWTTIYSIESCGDFPIKLTNYESCVETGKRFPADKFPTYFLESKVPEQLLELYGEPPCKFRKEDRVLVWNSGQYYKEVKARRYFSHKEEGKYFCYIYGKDKWSSHKETECWDNCELWEK